MRSIHVRAFLAVVASSVAVFAIACGGNAPPAASPAEAASSQPATHPAAGAAAEAAHHGEAGHPPASGTPSANVKEPGDAKIGDTSRCPVSGEEFVVTAQSPHAEKDGKTYYFCCSGCEQKFKKDPAKFTSKSKS